MRPHTAMFTLSFLGGVFALGLLALAWMLGSGASQAEDATMHNCPQPGKWAISVWEGPDSTDTGQALATCGAVPVIAAYYLNPQTQGWSYWFAGQPGLSTLLTLDKGQGMLALGSLEVLVTPTITPTPSSTPAFTVNFIDVGQGDAILIDKGDTDILVDGGPTSADVLAYLQSQGVSAIDLLVATHPHADHIGGLADVLAQYQVSEVWVNGDTATSQVYQNFAAAVAAEGATVREVTRGYTAQMDGLDIAVLNPSQLTGDPNEDSVVLRLTCDQVSVLLAGDATSGSETDMLGAGLALDSDVLKVGHHGSSTSTSAPFLAAVTPKDAVISVGAGNTYGHPAQETLNRLAAAGTTVYRTDQDGTVVLTSDCHNYSITTEVLSGSAAGQQGIMHNCPQAGKWAISVWDGPDGTDIDEALATCGAVPVIAAYYLDPQTQGWSYWFAGQPGIRTLSKLDNTQGILALGSAVTPTTPTPSPTATPTAIPTPTPTPTPTPKPTPPPTSPTCCKYCTTGKACGDSCISRQDTCHKPPGCACDAQ